MSSFFNLSTGPIFSLLEEAEQYTYRLYWDSTHTDYTGTVQIQTILGQYTYRLYWDSTHTDYI